MRHIHAHTCFTVYYSTEMHLVCGALPTVTLTRFPIEMNSHFFYMSILPHQITSAALPLPCCDWAQLKLHNNSCFVPSHMCLSVFAWVLLLKKILTQRQATSPKFHCEPKTTPAWQPSGKPNQTYRAWTISWSSTSWLSKLDWATLGLCKMKLWAKRAKFHSINESRNISPTEP